MRLRPLRALLMVSAGTAYNYVQYMYTIDSDRFVTRKVLCARLGRGGWTTFARVASFMICLCSLILFHFFSLASRIAVLHNKFPQLSADSAYMSLLSSSSSYQTISAHACVYLCVWNGNTMALERSKTPCRRRERRTNLSQNVNGSSRIC